MWKGNGIILAVDDDPLNLEIIEESLEEDGYCVVRAADGGQALRLLEEAPEKYNAVLLDRMMPKLDGAAVLAHMKESPRLASIPVIMQTAAAAIHQVRQGLGAGAYYYLTKPFDKEVLRAIVRSAVKEHMKLGDICAETKTLSSAAHLIHRGHFRLRTPDEARSLAAFLAGAFPQPESMGLAICELLLNAVEHGNLGLTYDDKSRLLAADGWEEEVARRLEVAPYAERHVSVDLQAGSEAISLTIKDQGQGFDWRPYIEFNHERMLDGHGRGIALAHQKCVRRLEYRGNGNEVVLTVDRAQPTPVGRPQRMDKIGERRAGPVKNPASSPIQ